MTKTPLLASGLNGLVGSRFKLDFDNKYDFQNLDLRDSNNPVDITDYNQVLNFFKKSKSDFILHLAAFTDVTAAWKQSSDKSGVCYQVNVLGTENIVKACSETNKHLIHVSTAFVFDGEKQDSYLETDKTGTNDWYGKTKLLAEEAIQKSEINWTILRIDMPFRSDSFIRVDAAHRVVEGLKNDSLYPQFTNHYFGPTYINDLAKIFDWVIRTKTKGLFHASSGEKWTDYDFAELINKTLKLNKQVKKSDLNDYLKTLDRPYPKNSSMNCDKLKALLDFKIKSISQAVAELEKD
jgi:dTDP-4-dehydrorhamnose reductase